MARLTLLLSLTIFGTVLALTAVSGQEDNGGTHPNTQQIERLCKDRPENEYFRLTTEGDCRDVVRCDRAGLTGEVKICFSF